MPIFITILTFLLSIAAFALWRHRVVSAREAHIRTFPFPKGLFAKVIAKYPHLNQKDVELVSHGLRQFFLAHLMSGKQYVAMPSQVADELWHEFILHTRSYQEFTRKAFGGFLHHTPAITLTGMKQSNSGLRRCWKFVCLEENINPKSPSRLPLLFVLDTKLKIANGFHYVPDCSGVRRQSGGDTATVHCGGDFSDNSFDGSTDGMSADGSIDGGGGSDGCGGGCGGD